MITVWRNAHGLHLDDAALVANGLHGVVAEVEQGLLYLRGVGHQRWQIVGFKQLQSDEGRQGHAQQAGRVRHDFLHLHGAALGLVIAAEGQNLAHQIAGAATSFFNLAQAFHGGGVARAVGLGQFHIAQNGTHDVVEVVGNAASHGAHRLHFVGLAQLRFQRVALGISALAAGQVAGKNRGGVAAAVVLKGDTDLDRNLASADGHARHFAQHGLRG